MATCLAEKELFIWFTARAFRKLLSIYVFSYFPFGFEGRIWDLIVSIPDHCLSFYFAPPATLVDENADLDSMVTHFNKAVTDTAAEFLCKQRRKRKPWVTPEIFDLCDQRRDLKKMRGEPEGAKDYREIKRKIRTEMKMAKETWIQGQCQEVEAYLRKNNSKKAYQLVKDLTTEKQDKSTTTQDKSGKCLTEENEILNRRTEYCSNLYNYETDQ